MTSRMKYNDPLVLRENESLSILLKHINKGSNILEFGCANGRMTKYMNETLACHVYIVEYEKEAFEEAIQYAEFGICDDIMNYTWLEAFENICFDYIIFADVLEHLYSPQEVLSNTRKLLKDNGSVLISVPNICHNDVIAKLYMNSFVYTDVGLLDDTHIRFFSENTLGSFCGGAGYKIVDRDFVTLESGTTEQLRDCNDRVNPLLWNMLLSRKNGNVYQYILILKKESFSSEEKKQIDKVILPQKKGKLYFNRGDGFTEEDKEIVYAFGEEEGEFIFERDIKISDKIFQIRYDPCENQSCVIEEVIISNNDMVEIEFLDCTCQNNRIFLHGNDPQIIFTLKRTELDELKIRVKFYTWGECYLKSIEEMLLECETEKMKTNNLHSRQIEKMQEEFLERETILQQEHQNSVDILEKEYHEQIRIKDYLIVNLKGELDNIMASGSWRLTKIFRLLKSKIEKMLGD